MCECDVAACESLRPIVEYAHKCTSALIGGLLVLRHIASFDPYILPVRPVWPPRARYDPLSILIHYRSVHSVLCWSL